MEICPIFNHYIWLKFTVKFLLSFDELHYKEYCEILFLGYHISYLK